jgi:radical SAM protein with 4Fe4S-binding SPASM domain
MEYSQVKPISAEMRLENIDIKAEEKCIPIHIHLELTYRCNLRCVHCYSVEDKKREELSYEEIVSLLDQLAEAGGFFLTLTGGDVFTRDDFFDIAFYAKKRHFAIRIFTNGTLIDKSAADRLAELNPLSVEFSLYGTNSDVHDGITTVKGSFEKLRRTIDLLKKRNITIFLKTVVMKPNLKECEGLLRLAKELGAYSRFDFEVTPRNDGSIEPLKYRLDEEEIFKFVSGDIPHRWEYVKIPPHAEAVKRQTCTPAKNGCAISAYGDIYPCALLLLPLGNVREKPFAEIWDSDSQALSDVRSIRTFSDLKGCSDCKDLWLCHRCHGLAYLESGDLRARYKLGCDTTKILKMVNEQARDRLKGG